MTIQQITATLAQETGRLTFTTPVTHVYNPLEYAEEPHGLYLQRYGTGPKEAVFLGMNPGPWGMAQTGVPFGEIGMVREWLGITGRVDKPDREHPKKPVTGFSCRRSEVSGRRLWGLFRARFGAPEAFFARFFVINYCPLLFMDAEGRNITPDKLRPADRKRLMEACDTALREMVARLQPTRIIGIGAFAAQQAEIALNGLAIPVGRILHPSPASPAANRNWEETALKQLRDQGVEI